MRKFTFRLEPLLRYREHLEKMAQQAVAEAHADLLACEKQIAAIADELQRTAHELDEKMTEGLSAEQYQFHAAYLSGVATTLKQEERRHNSLTEELAEKQTLLSRRSVERKVLENLKDRRKTEYYDQMAKLDQKMTEDMTIIRKIRGMTE